MTIIPFPTQAREPLAFTIGARVDLRVGALAGGVVRPRGEAENVFAFSSIARVLRNARMAWRERGLHAPLTLAVPSSIHAELDADMLTEAAFEAGCTRQRLSFELCEQALADGALNLADRLRAGGWGIVLRAASTCLLPFGKHARTLFNELVIEAPNTPDPYLALEASDESALGQRLLAARAAGITLVAESVQGVAHARKLAIAGFERGGGPFAEAGLR